MCTHYPEPTVATNKGRHGHYVLTLITLINVVFHTHSILNTPYIEPLSSALTVIGVERLTESDELIQEK